MQDNQPDFGRNSNNADPNPASVAEKEFLEIFKAFREIPKNCQQAYLLQLLEVPVPVIAKNLGISFDETLQRGDQAETALKSHFGPDVAWKDIERISFRLFAITVDSPQPFVKILPLVEKSLAIYNACAAESRRQYDFTVYREAMQPTQSELLEARKAVVEMEPNARDAFLMAEHGNMTAVDIAMHLGITALEFESRIEKAHEFLARRMEKLVAGYLKNRARDKDAPKQSLTEKETAKIAFKLMPGPLRSVYKRHKLPENALGALNPDDQEILQLACDLLTGRFETTVFVWLRLAMNGVPSRATVMYIKDNIEAVEVESVEDMGVIEFALNLMAAPLREAVVLLCGEHLESSEIEILQFLDESAMAQREHEAHNTLNGRIEYLIFRAMQHHRTGLNPAGLRYHEYEFARRLIRLIPKKCRKAYRGFLLTDLPLEKVGEKLGITVEQVQQCISEARMAMADEILYDTSQALGRIVDGRKVSQRILDRMRKITETPGFGVPLRLDFAPNEMMEAEKTFAAMNKDTQELATLFFGRGKDEFDVASLMGLRIPEVNAKLKELREIFRARMTSMVLGYLRTEENPDAVRMSESEKETGGWAFSWLNEMSADLLKRCLLHGDTAEDIAKALKLHAKRMEDRIESVERVLGIRMEMMVTRWLREKELDAWMLAQNVLPPREFAKAPSEKSLPDASTPVFAEEIFAPLPENETISFSLFSPAEGIEIEKMLKCLDYETREAFLLVFGAEVPESEVAKIQNSTVKTVNKRIKSAGRKLYRSMEQMIIDTLRSDGRLPGSRKMSRTEAETAMTTFFLVKEPCQKAFIKHKVEGMSLEQTAESLGVSVEQIEKLLKDARKLIYQRTVLVAGIFTQTIQDGRPVAERILGDVKNIRFPADIWNKLLGEEKIPDPSPVEDSLAVPRKTDRLQEQQPQASARGSIGSNRALTLPAVILGLSTQTGAASSSVAAKTATLSIGAWLLLAPAIPFLCFLSLFIGGHACGRTFVINAPTLQARQWLVKQLFSIYGILLSASLGLLNLVWIIKVALHLNNDQHMLVAVICAVIFIFTFLYSCYRIYRAGIQWEKKIESNIFESEQYSSLEKTINRWMNISGVFLVLYLGFITWDIVLPWLKEGKIAGSVFLAITFIVIYCSSRSLFFHFLSISENEEAFQATPPLSNLPKRTWIDELYCITLPALIPFIANIGHLLTENTHPVYSAAEILIFTALWIVIWYWNTKVPHIRLKSIFGAFAIQMTIMFVARYFYV